MKSLHLSKYVLPPRCLSSTSTDVQEVCRLLVPVQQFVWDWESIPIARAPFIHIYTVPTACVQNTKLSCNIHVSDLVSSSTEPDDLRLCQKLSQNLFNDYNSRPFKVKRTLFQTECGVKRVMVDFFSFFFYICFIVFVCTSSTIYNNNNKNSCVSIKKFYSESTQVQNKNDILFVLLQLSIKVDPTFINNAPCPSLSAFHAGCLHCHWRRKIKRREGIILYSTECRKVQLPQAKLGQLRMLRFVPNCFLIYRQGLFQRTSGKCSDWAEELTMVIRRGVCKGQPRGLQVTALCSPLEFRAQLSVWIK